MGEEAVVVSAALAQPQPAGRCHQAGGDHQLQLFRGKGRQVVRRLQQPEAGGGQPIKRIHRYRLHKAFRSGAGYAEGFAFGQSPLQKGAGVRFAGGAHKAEH